MGPSPSLQTSNLPADLDADVRATVEEWRAQEKVGRLWSGDASLWTGRDEAAWLGWLDVVEDRLATIGEIESFAREVRSEFSHALLLGMGGSSLCPEVMRKSFGKSSGFPELFVLDSTDPAQVKASEASVDLRRTLFIVSSKSGTTLEPNIFKQYFFERVRNEAGAGEAGRRFVAITDPRSKLHGAAEKDGFRRIFLGRPSIGGRYSALSDFGLVPSAIMGVDVRRLLERALVMVRACGPAVPSVENPGVLLGAVLGRAALAGRDKVTLVISPALGELGAWLEQLLAESTGKEGKGLIPVDSEPLGSPASYGFDRLFVSVELREDDGAETGSRLDELQRAGHPVVRIRVEDRYELGQEFLRWEMATAVAGSILGINPFNQPDVEASKVATRELTAAYEKTGSLPPETPLFETDGVKLFADARNVSALSEAARRAGERESLAGWLRAHLDRLRPGDYLALLAFMPMTEANRGRLQRARLAVRDRKRVATCLGFGPRFLHSTGQAYKGGPGTGVFLQVTCDDVEDIPVPGQAYTFGVVKSAQARGDLEVLAARGRRVLRAHLVGPDVASGLATLCEAVEAAVR